MLKSKHMVSHTTVINLQSIERDKNGHGESYERSLINLVVSLYGFQKTLFNLGEENEIID